MINRSTSSGSAANNLADVVLCDGDVSLAAHRELFRFNDGSYRMCPSSPVGCLCSLVRPVHKVHLALKWRGMLEVALWKETVAPDQVLIFLKDIGLPEVDLDPLKGADVQDIFPVLYYGKNFDMLRKVCNAARRSAEGKFRDLVGRFDCHMVSEETGKIVASSI